MALELGMDRFEGLSGQRPRPKIRWAAGVSATRLFCIAVLVLVVILFITGALGTSLSPDQAGAGLPTRAPYLVENEAASASPWFPGSPYRGESVVVSGGGSLHLMK